MLFDFYRKTLSDIFNPKISNTYLQNFAIGKLQILNFNLQNKDDKTRNYKKDIIKPVQELFHLIKSTDNDFSDSLNIIVENSKIELLKRFNAIDVKNYLVQFSNSLNGSDKINLAHSYISYFAKNLDEHIYNNMFRENKDIFKNINSYISEYLKKNIVNTDLNVLFDEPEVASKEIRTKGVSLLPI